MQINVDSIVGPTHHYGGLSPGNLASQRHAHRVSNPKRAALEGLEKMHFVASLGAAQLVLPPHERPEVATLRALGFSGDDAQVLRRAARDEPELLAGAASASAMWTANAATVSPAADTADGRVHFTPANLISTFHRSLEAPTTARLLQAAFPDPQRFAHHPPLPASVRFGDEGAANHMRLSAAPAGPGLEVFVYGCDAQQRVQPKRYPARQTLEASRAVARRHGLKRARTIFIQQQPEAIDAGAFHNDVVAVSNEQVLLYHEQAFVETSTLRTHARSALQQLGERRPLLIETPSRSVSLADAIGSYLFNSQLISIGGGAMAMLCPEECRQRGVTRRYLEALVADASNPIEVVHYLNVRQSMHNGGGPACLRLRVELDEPDRTAVHPALWFTDELHERLRACIERHYRDELRPDDLADPALLEESRAALDEMSDILKLGPVYAFQR